VRARAQLTRRCAGLLQEPVRQHAVLRHAPAGLQAVEREALLRGQLRAVPLQQLRVRIAVLLPLLLQGCVHVRLRL